MYNVRTYFLLLAELWQSSLDVERVICAQDHYHALSKITSIVDKLKAEKSEDAQATMEHLETISQILRDSLRAIWIREDNVFVSSR